MKKNFLLSVVMLTAFAAHANSGLQFIDAGTTSIFQPVFSDDTFFTRKISLLNQQIRVDVFQGYVVVRAEYWFNNPTDKTFNILASLLSCNKAGKENCSELFWLRVAINNALPFAPTIMNKDSMQKSNRALLINLPESKWQTWDIHFLPGVTEVTLNYGLSTGNGQLLTGNDSVRGNAFCYSFSNYAWWGSGKENGEIWMRMNGGYVTKDILGLLPDKKFLGGNSIVHCNLRVVTDDSSGEVLLWYRNLDEAVNNPSHISWESQFFKLNSWKVSEKTLATLTPFSATDFEGKALKKESETANSLVRWYWIGSVVLLLLFVGAFIYADRSNAA